MRATELWTIGPDGTPRPVRCHMPIWVSASGTKPADTPAVPPATDCVLLASIEPSGDACAVALVPDTSRALTLVNGARARAGLHVLRHADHLVVGGRAIWTSIAVTHDEVAYDPHVHGDPLYCFRTKARFEAGDPMIECRGRPRVDCGMKFSAAAWSAGIPCHNCGASSADPGWEPPAPRSIRPLEQLLHLTAQA